MINGGNRYIKACMQSTQVQRIVYGGQSELIKAKFIAVGGHEGENS